MANITIVSVLDRANIILVDTTKTRWDYKELLTWYNDAILAIADVRPDSQLANVSFTVSPNASKQTLPSDGVRWLDVMYNIATGAPITKSDRRQLDDQIPNWHKQSGSQVRLYVFDERDPKNIYVYPQPTTATDIQVCYSKAPIAVDIADFETDTTVIGVDDSYVSALVDFILHRAYSKDADYASDPERSMRHYNAFMASISQKTQVDSMNNPISRAMPRNG